MKDGLGQPRSHIAHALPAVPDFRHAVASREGGFTLIELMVVMGIIALAMAFLIPTLGPASGRAVDAAAGQFKADLEEHGYWQLPNALEHGSSFRQMPRSS